jgi:hypothetical protein
VIHKIPPNIIIKRLTVYTENIEYQCGFTVQIFFMRKIMEKCYEYNTRGMLSTDFRKALDRID